MKKLLSLIVLLAIFTSCEEDVRFNTPAVQGLKDNELWKASEFTAVKGSDNSLTITATNGFETVTLRTASISPADYVLGENQSNKASYVLDVDNIERSYQTGTGVGNGLITISDDPRDTDLAAGFISGTFRFNAYGDDDEVVNFQNGFFYKVPIAAAP